MLAAVRAACRMLLTICLSSRCVLTNLLCKSCTLIAHSHGLVVSGWVQSTVAHHSTGLTLPCRVRNRAAVASPHAPPHAQQRLASRQ